ncbi:7-cyano-7-deazaguanine synthase QueC [Phyllobacterium lublinensis]|uniref:7-cyano-7-deazaguanine synthase QueC n=1 Tax=Phyllobacterium lublinensis TaxID=2875708 RepID=UPI001CCBEB98|nr:7-cyano-7-deazaguanine synthase QueC [Phyllobacterium sp. 2063]MBZ9656525.1 7-cyano-7-deazaguanine synthase QueC [Phyllobacterium sp. 2063]
MARNLDGALVLFSGGQDSATCLAWALSNFDRVETVGFDYGQRHRIELEVRREFRTAIAEGFPQWAQRLGDDHMLDANIVGQLGASAMLDDIAIEMAENGLPNTFVPGRNLLFFTLAGALAYRRRLRVIVGGMCETDYSGYPDCRDDTLKALQAALSLGLDRRVTIETPLMWLDKAETFALAQNIGGQNLLDLIVEKTHTCYLGDRSRRHAWGYGCGNCPACELRAAGWQKFKAEAA